MPSERKLIALIAGTGLARGLGDFLESAEIVENRVVHFGKREGRILMYMKGRFGSLDIIVLPRHGPTLELPDRSPLELVAEFGHEAHIWHLHELGVQAIYAFNSVGALDLDIPLAKENVFIVPNDYARGFSAPSHTFGSSAKVVHPSMRNPFSASLRQRLITAAERAGASVIATGLYIYSNGDAFESVAEIHGLRVAYQTATNRVIGMTAGAEITLCRQMEIPYGLICANCNYAEGLADEVTHPLILSGMLPAAATMSKIAEEIIRLEAMTESSDG